MAVNSKKRSKETGTIQAVIFDLDGVLIDSEWLWFLEWQELVRQHGSSLADTVFPELVGTTTEESTLRIMHHAGIVLDVEETSTLMWQRVSNRLRSQLEPLAGARELVRELTRRGLPLAVASNSLGSYIQDALAALGMQAEFPVWVSREQVAEGKPAPDVYLRAAERLGVAPERCLAIEDSRVGVQSAAAAGMRVIAVPGLHDDPGGFLGAWRVCSSLDQIYEALDDILQGEA